MNRPKLFQFLLRKIAAPVRQGSTTTTPPYPPMKFRLRNKYNDLPTPQGSWKTNYESRNKRYNLTLLFGVLMIPAAIVTMKARGLLDLCISPPDRPVDKNDYST